MVSMMIDTDWLHKKDLIYILMDLTRSYRGRGLKTTLINRYVTKFAFVLYLRVPSCPGSFFNPSPNETNPNHDENPK